MLTEKNVTTIETLGYLLLHDNDTLFLKNLLKFYKFS